MIRLLRDALSVAICCSVAWTFAALDYLDAVLAPPLTDEQLFFAHQVWVAMQRHDAERKAR